MALTASARIEVADLKKTGRRMRRPSHPFQLRFRPWQVQPFCIAPVLPGDTMKNALLQVRAVSSPVKNPLVGWWYETFLFYIKLRDLPERDSLVAMLMTDTAMADNTAATAMVEMYDVTGKFSYARSCLKRVIDTYFRTPEEVTDAQSYKIGNLEVAQASVLDNWTNSLIADSDVAEIDGAEDLPGADTPMPEGSLIDPAYTDQYNHWLAMRDMGLVKAEFADWLRSFGVTPPQNAEPMVQLHKPELLRYLREWTYPANTVDPITGTPSSALSWSIAERADKDRFFNEPGFLFGVMVARPKIYLNKQRASVSQWLDNSLGFLPALLRDEPYTSLKKFLQAAGPLNTLGTPEAYWVDMKDLYLYGEQFVNFPFDGTESGVSLPIPNTADPEAIDDPPINKRYPVAADADALFSAIAPNNVIKCDGRIDFSILSRLDDTSK